MKLLLAIMVAILASVLARAFDVADGPGLFISSCAAIVGAIVGLVGAVVFVELRGQ